MQQAAFPKLTNEAQNTLEPWETGLDAQVERLNEKLIEIRRFLHAHPEPSGQEVETSKFIVSQLNKKDIDAKVCKKGVGVIANFTVGNPHPGTPLIAIRGDIDALRMPDGKTVTYKSQNAGIAHACGHDSHATMVMGAALAAAEFHNSLSQNHEQFGMRLRFLFQPAEETSEGAAWLVEAGALDEVDAILGLHVDPERPAGQVGIRYGVLTANCDEIKIKIDGHGGHAARPHHTIDSIAASAQLISVLYQALPRSIDSRNPAVFSIGQIAGGYAPNVIPEQVELWGTLRTTDDESRKTLKQRIAEIIDGVQEITGTKISFRFYSPLKAVDNHPNVAAALEEASRRILGPKNITIIDQPSMGGEDFSVYLDSVPGAMFRLGCAIPEGNSPFLHSPVFDIDERAIAFGTRILIRAALLLTVGMRSRNNED